MNVRHVRDHTPTGDPGATAANLRVLFLIHDLRAGGAERVLITYANHARRITPVVALVRPLEELRSELGRDIPVHDLATRGSGVVALARKMKALARLADATDCVLISTFLHKSHVIAMAAKTLVAPRLRVVINVHELMTTYHAYHHGPLARLLLRIFTRWFFPRADLVVAVAESVRRDLIERFGVPARCVRVLRNPLDLELIRRGAAEPVDHPAFTPPAGPVILAAGRLVPLKGFEVLIRAFGRLAGHPTAQLVILGEGEERPRLERLARDLGLAPRVHLAGLQRNPWRYMARADVVALSSHTEAFPNVIGEAMALGRPVVATNCADGVREYLEDGRCGLLVPPGDDGALAEALDRVLRDGELRHRLIQAGLVRVAAFDAPTMTARYEDALAGVMA